MAKWLLWPKPFSGILLLCYLIVILSSSLFVVIITIHSFC